MSSHFYEIVSIVPVSGIVLASFFLNFRSKTNSGIESHHCTILRIWSSILLGLLVLSYSSQETLNLVVGVPALILVLSGYFVSHSIAQQIFHVGSSCSWIGCFDMYARITPQNTLRHLMYWKWLVAIFMTTSIVLRGVLNNKWQFNHPSLKYVGIPLICLYYWGLEIPICDTMGEMTGVSCELSHRPPPRLASCGIDDHYRMYGLLAIVVIHVLYGHLMSAFFVDECRENRTPSELERGCGESLGEEQLSVHEGTEDEASRKDSLHIMPLPSTRSQARPTSLPDDLVEISEEEAIAIVQKGLLNFKTRRAN